MIKTPLVFLLFFLLGIFIQATLIHSLFPDVVVPDFLVILVVFLGIRSRNPLGAVGAFLIGVGGDFATARFVGPFAAGSVIAFYLTVFIADHLFSEKGFTVAFTAFVASLAKNVAAGVLLLFYTDFDFFRWKLLSTLLLEALFTALLCPLILKVITWGKELVTYGVVRTRRV
jgi:rod shape-determining protein MreD